MNTQVNAAGAGRISRIAVNDGRNHLLVTKAAPGKYTVVGYADMPAHHSDFGFEVADCAASVENLDFTSDYYDCWGTSVKVKVGECIFGVDVIEGPNLDVLRDAAKGLVMSSFDGDDV